MPVKDLPSLRNGTVNVLHAQTSSNEAMVRAFQYAVPYLAVLRARKFRRPLLIAAAIGILVPCILILQMRRVQNEQIRLFQLHYEIVTAWQNFEGYVLVCERHLLAN